MNHAVQVLLVNLVLVVFSVFALFLATASQAAVDRPYSADAAWNIPVSFLTKDPNSAQMGQIFHDDSPNTPGNIEMNFGYQNGFTFPVYDAADKSGDFTVSLSNLGNIDGTTMPYNTTFVESDGSDAQVIVLDLTTGQEWNLFQASFDGTTVSATNGSVIQNVESPLTTTGDDANYNEKENSWFLSREAGIQYFAMLGRPEEITRGVIPHAFATRINNVDGCTHRRPAIKHAHPARPCGLVNDVLEVGTRCALNVTDAEIETHLSGLPSDLPQAMIDSLRIIAVALRDYGWFMTDTTSGGPARFDFEDKQSADADYQVLELDQRTSAEDGLDYPRNGLQDIFTTTNIDCYVASDEYGTLNLPPVAGSAGLMGIGR